jgi:hypothetical protein
MCSSFILFSCIGDILVCFLKESSCRLICWSSSSSFSCCESIQWLECVWLVFGWRTTLTDCHWRWCHSSGLRYCRHILTSQPDGLSLEIRSQSRLNPATPLDPQTLENEYSWVLNLHSTDSICFWFRNSILVRINNWHRLWKSLLCLCLF